MTLMKVMMTKKYCFIGKHFEDETNMSRTLKKDKGEAIGTTQEAGEEDWS